MASVIQAKQLATDVLTAETGGVPVVPVADYNARTKKILNVADPSLAQDAAT